MALLSFGGVTFDPDTCEVAGGVSPPQTVRRSVGRILTPLMAARGRLVSRRALVDAMWDNREDGPMDKQLDVIIHRLRRDLAVMRAPIFVANEWGHGYRVTTDVVRRAFARCPHCGKPLI